MLFNRSIRDNLLIGRPEATQEEIERACRQADAHEFIIRQARGYDSMIGERGARCRAASGSGWRSPARC